MYMSTYTCRYRYMGRYRYGYMWHSPPQLVNAKPILLQQLQQQFYVPKFQSATALIFGVQRFLKTRGDVLEFHRVSKFNHARHRVLNFQHIFLHFWE